MTTNFWTRFVGWLAGNPRLEMGEIAPPAIATTTAGGGTVNGDTALKLSAVWACVRLRSQTIASLPLHLRDNTKRTASTHPLYRLLHDAPNADMTASEFWEAMVASLDLWGNAYAHITRLGDTVVSLNVLNPERISVHRSKSGVITYQDDKTRQSYTDTEILHIKGFTLDGLIGLSPLRHQAGVMGAQIDANDAANEEFRNSLKVGGFLKTGEQVLTPQQRTDFQRALGEFRKPENSGKWMLLEAGMDVASAASIKINPADAQLLESRYFGIEEICRTFGVPPQLIHHTDKASSWASSAEQMNLAFLMYSLRPTLVRIEQAIVRKLLTPAERSKYTPKFSVEGLLRADSQGRANFYTSALQNGWMTRNEIRSLEDLPPVEGADQLTVQLNLTDLAKLGQEPTET